MGKLIISFYQILEHYLHLHSRYMLSTEDSDPCYYSNYSESTIMIEISFQFTQFLELQWIATIPQHYTEYPIHSSQDILSPSYI